MQASIPEILDEWTVITDISDLSGFDEKASNFIALQLEKSRSSACSVCKCQAESEHQTFVAKFVEIVIKPPPPKFPDSDLKPRTTFGTSGIFPVCSDCFDKLGPTELQSRAESGNLRDSSLDSLRTTVAAFDSPREKQEATPWYFAAAEKPRMQQVVIDVGKAEFKPAHRMLMLTGPYARVYERFWTSALIKLDDEKHPTLLIKANESTRLLKDYPFRIGVSFIKGAYGNLFSVFVHFDGPAPFNCPTKPLVVFEDILGMDFREVRDRLLQQMEMQSLNIWLIEGGDVTRKDEFMMSAEAIDVTFETTIPIDPDCRKRLATLAKAHIEEHVNIGEANWDFQRSHSQFANDLPITLSPILSRDGGIRQTAMENENQIGSEQEVRNIVIYFDRDPGYSTLPDFLKQKIFEFAAENLLVITNRTKFDVYRNSKATVASVKRGHSAGLITAAEVLLKEGGRDPSEAAKLSMKLSSGSKQLFIDSSGWFSNKRPRAAVVFLPTLADREVSQNVVLKSLEEVWLHPIGGPGFTTRRFGTTQFSATFPIEVPFDELRDWLVSEAGRDHIRIHEFQHRGHKFFMQEHSPVAPNRQGYLQAFQAVELSDSVVRCERHELFIPEELWPNPDNRQRRLVDDFMNYRRDALVDGTGFRGSVAVPPDEVRTHT